MSNAEHPDNDFEDVVVGGEEATTEAPQPERQIPNLPDDPTEIPASVLKELREGKPLLKDEKAEDEKKAIEEARSQRDRDVIAEQLRTKTMIKLIKDKKEVIDAAPAFLRDMAGIERYSRSYDRMGIVEADFQTLTSDDLQQIEKQYARDAITGRLVFRAEVRFSAQYRLAASCSRIAIMDPQTGKYFKLYTPDSHKEMIDSYTDSELHDYDTPLRRRSLYLLNRFLSNGVAYEHVANMFTEFEMHLNELSLLAAEEPDFFRECLTAASSQG